MVASCAKEKARGEDEGWRLGVRLEVGVGLVGRNWRGKEKEKGVKKVFAGKSKSSLEKSSQCWKMVEGSDLTRI